MRFTSFRFLRSKKAFSLVELSVAIIIVGIFIAGVTQGAKMVNTFRLQSAQTLTLSSPVASTAGLVLWLEPTMPQSFLDVESVDGSQITKWIDRNPQATVKLSANASASAGIVYKEQSDIYGLPAVAFSGSSSAVLTLNNGSSNIPIITPNSAYTLFVVAKLSDDSSSALKTVFSNGDSSGWGYGVSGSQNNRSRNLIFSGSSDVTSATANATTRPEVISALYAGGAGGNLQLFTNGVGNAGTGEAGTLESLSASTATAASPTSAFYVGNKSSAAPWTGLISEIIIFNRTLSTKERNSIELYLGQKYNIKTATTGNIEGCPVSIAGVTQTRVDEGASSLPCLATGYSGTVAYDCSGGTLTPSGSCAVFQCAINGEAGIINGTMVNYAASSTPLTCNDSASGYSGSINYTCTNGGGFDKVSGNCSVVACTISSANHANFNDKTNLGYASTPTLISSPCQAGYSGSPTYTCITSGAANVSGTCSVPFKCSSGGTITVSGAYRVHTFFNTSSGSELMSCNGSPLTNGLSMLVVGAGGAGGSGNSLVACGFGGGGGGGQVIEVLNSTIPSGVTSISVNFAGRTLSSGSNGDESSVISNEGSINITAYGGAYGGRVSSITMSNNNISSRPGGGAASRSGDSIKAGGLGAMNGGSSPSPGVNCTSNSPTGGGGGGSTAYAGGDGISSTSKGGNGGNGVSSSVPTAVGYYGCGGGGGGKGAASTGGNCDSFSGTGAAYGVQSAKDGANSRGGGGGGASPNYVSQGRGGSGIVIIAYPNS